METSLGALLRQSWGWLRDNWVRTVVFSVVSFLVCWSWNIWLLARAAGGGGSDDVAGTDSVATSAGGSSLNGIYWLVASSIGFGLFTYGRERGFANALGDLLRVPSSIVESFRTSWAGAAAMLLWGMVIGLALGGFLPAAVSGVLGAGFVLLSVTPVAAIVNNVLIRLFVGITSANAPRLRVLLAGMASPFLVMVGEALGLLACRLADLSIGPALVGAAVCGVLAYALGAMAGKAAPSVAFALVAGLALAAPALLAEQAAADDGGWAECFDAETGEPCKGLSGMKTWWDSPGASELRDEARTGGFFGAFGAIGGAVLGGAFGNLARAKRGWKLPGGGFGTEPVELKGAEAADVLRSKGLVEPVDGGFKWAGSEPPAKAGSALAGTELPAADGGAAKGGTVARAAVEVPVRPDGLIDVEELSLQAEVLPKGAAAGVEAPAAPPFSAPGGDAGGVKAPFDVPGAGAGEAKGAFEVPGGGGDVKSAFEVPGGAGDVKSAFEVPGAGEGGGDVKSVDAGGGGPAEGSPQAVAGAGAGKGPFDVSGGGEAKGPFDVSGGGEVKGPFDLPGAGEGGGDVKSVDAGGAEGAGPIEGAQASAAAADPDGSAAVKAGAEAGTKAGDAGAASAADVGDGQLPEDVLPDEDKFRRDRDGARDDGDGDGHAAG